MTFYIPPWDNALEPSQGNIRQWLDNLYSKYQPIEQARWNQSNIDTLFYAGCQTFVNRYFNFSPTSSYQQYYFNLVQQPVNIITGYQRQHRKATVYQAINGADPQTTDQYTRLISNVYNSEGIHEQFSKACELAAISGMVLTQPYLDFSTGDDQAQGTLRLKVWEYNSFLVDPYFRMPDMSDAQFFWTQEYISKNEAQDRFPDQVEKIKPMAGSPQRYGNFYFLPENHNMARNDLMVLSYIWYKWRRRKKRLYSQQRDQFFDFTGNEDELEELAFNIPDLEIVEVEVPTWKLAVVLNDQLMYQGENPLKTDSCPVVPVFWNYEPHNNYYDLRIRSLVRTMRDPQFLFNYKVITNNDIAASIINSGWKRKLGAVANEDNLKKTQAGWDIVINPGYQMEDVQKIIPTGIPESDMMLAKEMADLVYKTSGIDLENWSGQSDSQISSLTMLIKQAANLMVFQKYFDQWDLSLKLLGDLSLQVLLNNWSAAKVGLIIGEEPSPFFYSKIFSKYQTVVEEGLLTPTQKNLQAQQMMDINQAFGREVIPPSMIIKDMNIQGKAEIMQFLQQQEEQMAAAQSEAQNIQQAFEEAKMQELMAKIHNQLSMARERDSRSASNVGLFEERIAEVQKNHAISTREKMEALMKLLEAIQKFGEVETFIRANQLDAVKMDEETIEDAARRNVERTQQAQKFSQDIMENLPRQQMQNMQ